MGGSLKGGEVTTVMTEDRPSPLAFSPPPPPSEVRCKEGLSAPIGGSQTIARTRSAHGFGAKHKVRPRTTNAVRQ